MQIESRLLVDLASIGWASILVGKDAENGYKVTFGDKQVSINTAEYGFENAMEYVADAMKRFKLVPSDVILVKEGMNSKTLRKTIMPQYKESRESRPPESYEEFNKLKDMLIKAWRRAGASICWQDGVEGDDVLAYLAQNLEGRRIILTSDGDLTALVAPGIDVWRKDALSENPYGPFPHKFITLYKSLVGDTSDNIPGAKGFGAKAFLDLYCLFGDEGLEAFEALVVSEKLGDLQEDVRELKALQKVIDNADTVIKSYACAKLYPNKVNTLRMPLQWQAGMVHRRTKATHDCLKPSAGQVKLVHADNYASAVEFITQHIAETPDFALDIETSTSDESDEWLETAKGKSIDDDRISVDVFGSVLTGFSITFGNNRQYAFYFTVNHREVEGVRNITSRQGLDVVKLIPKHKICVAHNSSFELSVLYQAWGTMWADNGWHGFVPNCHDTAILSSYVDENESRGLKKLSARLLDYRQETYNEVTSIVFDPDGTYVKAEGEECTVVHDGTAWPNGRLIAEGGGWEKRQYRMCDLTATHVLSYGADDTICTAALFNFFRIIMEIEKTWKVYQEVEILPAYVTALAFVQGTKCSVEKLKDFEREDAEASDKAWGVFAKFLIEKGWEGTVCPVYTEITPTTIKEAFQIIHGEELKTAVRTLGKLAILVAEKGGHHLSKLIERNDLEGLNKCVAAFFSGSPDLNFDSPKQMQKFLYQTLDLPVRIVNKLTPKQREDNKELAEAVRKHNKVWQGSKGIEITDAEKELLKLKAATDDTAVDFALAMDATEEQKIILNAMVTMKKTATRSKLYYKPYPNLLHWRDGRLHSSMNQSAAVTRRYTSSGPNLQQLAKGKGARIREVIIPHRKDAVICSVDFGGQELRILAEESQDKNMLACYVGDKLRDMHSITAAGAMAQQWGEDETLELARLYGEDLGGEDANYDLFVRLHKSVEDRGLRKRADDLRKVAKGVNFSSAYGCMAPKLAQLLIIPLEDAQSFLDAKYAMFPRAKLWIDEVVAKTNKDGFATTMMGARRHLQSQILSDDKWIAEKAGRQAPNFLVQSSASEMTKLAIARLWKSGILHSLDMQFIAPIHDELVWSVSYEDALESIKVVHECMTAPYSTMQVPIMGSISLGPNFGDQRECGDWVIEENILAALKTVKEEAR